MQYLLDTHSFLWFIKGDEQLSAKARQYIEDPDNEGYISIVSFWEMSIKIQLDKLRIAMPFKDLYKEADKNGLKLLPVTFAHTEKLLTLSLHHRDPFDRMLISQAIIDKLPIVGKDRNFEKYKVTLIW